MNLERTGGFLTFGHLLLESRLRAKFAQAELVSISGHTTYNLSDLERNKVKPTREDIDALSLALGFSPSDKNLALLLADYPPTDVDVTKALEEAGDFLQQTPLPVLLRDYTGRIIGFNEEGEQFLSFSKQEWTEKPYLLEVLFNSIANLTAAWQDALVKHVALARNEAPRDLKHEWLRELFVRLKDKPGFSRAWLETSGQNAQTVLNSPVHGYAELEYPVTLPNGNQTIRTFKQITRPLFQDPRFQVDVLVQKAA